MTSIRQCWLDLRAGFTPALAQEAVHQGIEALVINKASDIANLPPSIQRVLILDDPQEPGDLADVDIVLLPSASGQWAELRTLYPQIKFGRHILVEDADSLEVACAAARMEPVVLLEFRDTTKIPLEIVIAAAAQAKGTLVTVAQDLAEAEVIFGVLEHGSEGVLLLGLTVGDATELKRIARDQTAQLELVELAVTATAHVGMGERACVDTCSFLGQDEGILVGSTSKGLILCVSETHPLPYMPTRPFRVNAGAIHSYALGVGGRTTYLSELVAGGQVLAVNTSGRARPVTVGRVKIESRPLLSIDAVAADGRTANLIVQDDWHVRVLGPGGAVLNSTELKPGDKVLAYLPTSDRHVGYPINEFCREQ